MDNPEEHVWNDKDNWLKRPVVKWSVEEFWYSALLTLHTVCIQRLLSRVSASTFWIGSGGSRKRVSLDFINNLSIRFRVSTSRTRTKWYCRGEGVHRVFDAIYLKQDLVMWESIRSLVFINSCDLSWNRSLIKKTYRTYVGVDASAVNLLRQLCGLITILPAWIHPRWMTKWSMSWEVSVI